MIMYLITNIVAIVGIICFYNNIEYVTIISAIILVLENLRGFFTGQLKSLFTFILFVIIGIFIGLRTNNVLPTVCVSVCYESVIIGIISIPLVIVSIKLYKTRKKEEEKQELLSKYLQWL